MVNRNKLARIVGALALPFVFSGCNESLTPRQERGMYSLTRWGYDYGMQQERNDAIRGAGGNLVVNVNSPTHINIQNPKENIKQELRDQGVSLFTFNYLTDFNNNGIDSIDEFTGVKDRFRKNEKIILGSIIKGQTKKYSDTLINIPRAMDLYGDEESETKLWNVKIYNPIGEEIYNKSMNIPNFKDYFKSVGINDNLMDFLLNNGGLGNYKVALYLNGAFSDSHEFEIIE